jgi:hypothetical protein
MDNLGYMFGYMMGRAMSMVAYCTVAAVIEKMMKAERERVKAALGHEPTQENWQYYYELQEEKADRRKVRRWEDDREKLWRLVFGEDVNSSENG